MRNIHSIALYFYGTLRISLSGDFCERLLNILAANGVVFKNLKKRKNHYEITVRMCDFKKIRILKRKSGVKIRIISKNGFPILLKKYKMRYGFVLGGILFFIILNILAGRMWIIKVIGSDSPAHIKESVRSLGIVEGMSMNKIDTDTFKMEFTLANKDIAWASFNKQGSVLEVNLTNADSENKETEPRNIISKYDAIIKKMDIENGAVKVKLGDTVAKGQILVSGIVNYGSQNTFVSARGKIIAQAKVTEKISIPKMYAEKIQTNEYSKRNVLNVMGINIPLYLGEVRYECEKTFSEKNLQFLGGEIPISFREIEYNKIITNTYPIEINEAAVIAEKMVKDKYTDSEIVKVEKLISTQDENNYIFTYSVTINTDIVDYEKISLDINEKN